MTLFAELGMRYPVIQAPMAGVQDSALAMAATSAGALGSLPAAMLSGADLRQELSRQRAGPIQHQLLLPSAARAGTGSGAALAPGTVTLLRRVRGGCRCAVASPLSGPLQ